MRSVIACLVFVLVAVIGSSAGAAALEPDGQWPDLTTPMAARGGGAKDVAVIVGVEDYVFAPDIPGATTNAEAWYRHLITTRGVPAANVHLIRNDEATREEIRGAVEAASAAAEVGGNVWFVFIGHGAPSADGNDGLLVGADAQQTSQSLEARSLRRSDLLALLESSAGRPVVIIDACFSGRGTSGESLAQGLQPLRVAQLQAPASALVLTAAQSNQYAGSLPGKDVPAFSYLLLGAVRGWADEDADGRVTAEEAIRYSGGVMRSVIKGRTQSPDLGGPGGVVLGSAVETGPDLAEIVLATASSTTPARLGDDAPSDTNVRPVSESEGLACIDDRGCGEGTSCQGGTCRTDHVYLARLEASATRLVTAGGVTLGISGTALTGVVVAALVCSLGDRDCGGDSESTVPFSVVGTSSLAGSVAGAVALAVGRRRRKHARSLRHAHVLHPSLGADPRTVVFSMSGRF